MYMLTNWYITLTADLKNLFSCFNGHNILVIQIVPLLIWQTLFLYKRYSNTGAVTIYLLFCRFPNEVW